MKRFIIRSIFFLVPLVALLISFEYVQRQAPHEFKYKAAFMDQHAEQLEMLVFGPSFVHRINLYGIKYKAFNLSFPNQPLEQDYALWQKYRSRLTSLKYVVVALTCWTHENTADGLEAWRTPFYNIHYRLPSSPFDLQKSYIIANPKSAIKRMDVILQGDIDPMQPACDSLGSAMILLQNRPANWDGRAGAFMARRHSVYTPEKATKNHQILERLVSEISAHGAHVLLVTTPTRPAYYEHLTPEIIEKTITLGTKLANNYPHVSYLNLLKGEAFTEEDFMDDLHINYDFGGRRLAQILQEYITAHNL